MHLRHRNLLAAIAAAVAWLSATTIVACAEAPPVLRAADRTDSFETKMKLLEEAWQRRDFDLARSLTHSLRDTLIQTQAEQQAAGPPAHNESSANPVELLPPAWREWARGWKFFQRLSVEEQAGEARSSEPVEIALCVPSAAATSLRREVRIARVERGRLVEVPCQVFREVRRGQERCCNILLMVSSRAKQRQELLVLFGNADAELPDYPSDLKTTGDGFALDIANAHFKASLSRQMGQLERLTLRREHGLELFSGGEGHGEPPGIDWAHDYADAGHFQKFRITLWETCPDYEVIRGPLCTIVRRWGFPHSPLHPVYSPARLHVDVEYRFYAGLPWFHKIGAMKAVQTFEAAALRDDEWVFSGQSFTDKLWMGRDGKLHTGDAPANQLEDLWGVGFYNRTSRDSFIALFLEHRAEGLPEPKHSGAPTMFYRWHGSVWSRYPLPVGAVPKGAVLRQKNAYVAIPFTEAEGKPAIEKLRREMMSPLAVSTGSAAIDKMAQQSPNRLARPGEAGDAPLPKRLIWEALRDCKDAQLYTADVNVVDLGLVEDVRVRGDVVTVVMSMPHRGRPRLNYFVDGSISVHPTLSVPVRERLMKVAGIRQVAVEQSWDPGWEFYRLTDLGRSKLRLK